VYSKEIHKVARINSISMCVIVNLHNCMHDAMLCTLQCVAEAIHTVGNDVFVVK